MSNERITSFCRRHPMVPALVAGVVTGAGARLLKLLVGWISRLATIGFRADHQNWWLIILGIAAIALSGAIVRKVVRMPLEHSTGRMKKDLAEGKSPLPLRITIAPIAVSSLTLGLGGSAGSEGPIAYAGGAIASNIARRLGMTPRQLLVFLACGAGAGIAAIFKAPVGGMFFTIEVLGFSLGIAELAILAAMCLSAGLTAYALGGFVPDLAYLAPGTFHTEEYLAAIALGLWCGVYSLYYLATGLYTDIKLTSVKQPWIRNLIAGAILGVLLFMFPALYGEGYGVLDKVLNGNIDVVTQGTFAHGISTSVLAAICLAGILLVKGVATYATNSGGGVAGDFAPTIFAGGMAGALFAMGAAQIPMWETIPSGHMILLGMAGVMAGAIRAPFMAIFLVVEMTATPNLLLPLCITSGISYAISKYMKFPIPLGLVHKNQ